MSFISVGLKGVRKRTLGMCSSYRSAEKAPPAHLRLFLFSCLEQNLLCIFPFSQQIPELLINFTTPSGISEHPVSSFSPIATLM